MTKYDAKIAEYIVHEFGINIETMKLVLAFGADLKYSSFENDKLESNGTYTFVDNVLTMTESGGDIRIAECDLKANSFVATTDVKESLIRDFERSLKAIVGEEDYPNFVLETATLNCHATRID